MSLVDGSALAERFAGFTLASVLANRTTSDFRTRVPVISRTAC